MEPMTLLALQMYDDRVIVQNLIKKGSDWLLAQQNEDGGWGGERGCPSSLEETALALEALASNAEREVLIQGAKFIAGRTEGGKRFPVTPIGFYFAKLWYFEKLYPHIWVVSALERVSARLNRQEPDGH
jgi:squalene-hopene/tetraprenyl-beta-curcumene cyclase